MNQRKYSNAESEQDSARQAAQPKIHQNRVRQLAATGLSRDQIATLLGIDECALKGAAAQGFDAAIERGRAEGLAQVVDALRRAAANGDSRAVALRAQMIESQPDGSERPLAITFAGVQSRPE